MAPSAYKSNESGLHRQQAQSPIQSLPPRMSSLRTPLAPPQQPPPPIPLSNMTMEELMQILPTLNAAIVAHDWVPCMQKRQHELKRWLQNSKPSCGSNEALNSLDKARYVDWNEVALADEEQDLARTIDQSKDVAQSYYKLFEVAKALQEEDAQMRSEEIDQANSQRSEAIIALARHVSMHNDKCARYERQMEEYKDKTFQSITILRAFIRQHLGDVLQRVSHLEVERVFNAFVEADDTSNFSTTHVRAEIYRDLQKALQKSEVECDGLRDVCTEQMTTIRQQSKDLDEYIKKMAKVFGLVQEKENENRQLKAQIAQLSSEDARKQSATAKVQETENQRIKDVTAQAQAKLADHIVWTRDAEINNLRQKLDKSFVREKELQSQIRQLLQTSAQIEHGEKPPSRLKRLLGTQPRSTPNIPTMNSMHNLSTSVFSPFTKTRAQPPASPPISGRTSPTSGSSAFCDQPSLAKNDSRVPPSHIRNHGRTASSPERAPRLISNGSSTSVLDDIDTAVTNRFQHPQNAQMPANIRSNNSFRPPTPKGYGPTPYEELTDVPVQHQSFRPRLNSAPEAALPELDQSAALPRTRFPYNTRDQYEEYQDPNVRVPRVLSGITEVTEDGAGSMHRRSDRA